MTGSFDHLGWSLGGEGRISQFSLDGTDDLLEILRFLVQALFFGLDVDTGLEVEENRTQGSDDSGGARGRRVDPLEFGSTPAEARIEASCLCRRIALSSSAT